MRCFQCDRRTVADCVMSVQRWCREFVTVVISRVNFVTRLESCYFSAFNPSGVGKWVPASAGKLKAGMVHFVSGCMLGVQVKLWDPLRTRAIPERLGKVCSWQGTIQIRVYLILPCVYRIVDKSVPGPLKPHWRPWFHKLLSMHSLVTCRRRQKSRVNFVTRLESC